METKIKALLALTAIAVTAIVGVVLLLDGVTTGMISGQQKIPYSYVYGKASYSNPCARFVCPDGGLAMPVRITRYTDQVTCQCPQPYPVYEEPAYVKIEK
ncbi:hypothetical protein KY346_05385 [Candidatus Woesearchaeota archaeon]|nr:hypothetical protein [Candidatus Woesearchaeota archaeon]